MSRAGADPEGGGHRAARKAGENSRSFEPLKMESIVPCILSKMYFLQW